MLGIAISAVLFMGLVLPAHAQIEKSDLYIGLLLDFGAEATDARTVSCPSCRRKSTRC